jgi:hypothetical protein
MITRPKRQAKQALKRTKARTRKIKSSKAATSQYEADLALQEYEGMLSAIKGFVYAAVIKKKNAWAIELAVQDLKSVPAIGNRLPAT